MLPIMSTQDAASSAAEANKTKKRDPHYRPDEIDPGAYVQVGLADTKSDYFRISHEDLRGYGIVTGNTNPHSPRGVPFDSGKGKPNYQCYHCHKRGSGIRYFVFFLHLPTRKVVCFGRDCAVRFKLTTKRQADIERERDAYKRSQGQNQWRDEHQAEYDFLKAYADERERGGIFVEFYADLWRKLGEYGSLTENQVNGLRKWMENSDRHHPAGFDPDRHKAEVIKEDEPVTNPQRAYISALCEELDVPMPKLKDKTRAEASEMINDLKRQKHERDNPDQGNGEDWRNKPVTERQLTKINALMESRIMSSKDRQDARKAIDKGLTRGRASDCITWLEGLREAS